MQAAVPPLIHACQHLCIHLLVQFPYRCNLCLQGECGQWWLVRVLAGQEELLDFPLLCNKSNFIVVLVILTAIQSSLGNFYIMINSSALHLTHSAQSQCTMPPNLPYGLQHHTRAHHLTYTVSIPCSAPPDPFKSGSGSEPQRT